MLLKLHREAVKCYLKSTQERSNVMTTAQKEAVKSHTQKKIYINELAGYGKEDRTCLLMRNT